MTLDEEHGEVDSLMDQVHTRRQEIDAQMAEMRQRSQGGVFADQDVDQITILTQERKRIDGAIKKMLNSPHAPVGYLEHYNQKYMTPQEQPQEPAPEEPGLLSKIFTGVKDTAKFAVQNPKSALAHTYLGAKEFTSLPLRGIEGLLDRDIPGIHARQNIKDHQAALAKADQEAGIDPRGTGPVVFENVGQMAVPIPLKVGPTASFRSLETAKNVGKGAAFGAGAYATERVANDEPVDATGLMTSGVVGGGLMGVLGRFMGRKGSTAAEAGPSGVPPNAGGTVDNIDPSFVRGTSENPLAPSPGVRRLLAAPPEAAPATGGQPTQPTPQGPPRGLRNLIGPNPEKPVAELTPSPTGPVKSNLEVANVPPGSPQAQAPVAGAPVAQPKPLDTLLQRPQPKPAMPSMADAARGIQEEQLARQAAPPSESPLSITPKQTQAIPPNKIIDVAKQVDDEVQRASGTAILKDVLSGKVKANDVKVKPKKGDALAPAVQGEAGVQPKPGIDYFGEQTRNVAHMKPTPANALENTAQTRPPANTLGAGATQKLDAAHEPQSAKAAPKTAQASPKPKQENVRLEDYLKREGLEIETKEPFPGEKSYNVKDPLTGNTLARGDREQLVNALNARNEGKGFKLYSGVDPTPLYDKVKKVLGKVPDDVEITNAPHRERLINMNLRNLETPQFNMRKNQAGKLITEAGIDFEDLKHTRVNDLFHEAQKDGTFKETKAMEYFAGSAADKQKVNDVLVVGDRIGAEFSTADLASSGMTSKQISMYEGVREMLNKTRDWLDDLGKEAGRLKGYIPRVWHGELELFVDGVKYVPTKGDRTLGSSFSTLHEASPTIWKLKQANPGAKIEARFFSDPNYLMHRGIRDAKEVGVIKAKLDKMGTMTKDQIDELFHVSKSYKDFSKHLLERGDAQGYETEGLDKVLYSYINQAAKAVEGRRFRDTVEKVIKDEGTKLSEAQTKFLEGYVDRVLGKPTWDEMYAKMVVRDTAIGKWLAPNEGAAVIKGLKDFTTYKSLGFGNVSWALVNTDTLTRHVWPMLQAESKGVGGAFASEKYLGGAVKEFFKNKTLRQKLAHHNVIDIQQMSEVHPTVQKHLGKWTAGDVIMFLGKQTEEFVRGVSAIARYRMALDQGMDDFGAMRTASRFVARTAGRYSKAGKPQAFTGMVGSSMGMFKTYPIVMLENMTKAFETKDVGVITRYMLASLAAGGVIGAIPGSEEMDKLATHTLGKSPIQWGYENLGDGVMTGLASLGPGEAKVDLSRKAGLPDIFPNSTKDWLGPVWNTYGQAIADVLNGEYGEAAKDLIPTSLKNALAVSQQPGKVVGRYDKPLVDLPPGQTARIKRGLGFQSPEEVRALRDYTYLDTLADSRESELKKLTRKIYAREASQEERQRFAQLGGSNRRIREEGKRETLTLRQRQERHLPKMLRHQRPDSE